MGGLPVSNEKYHNIVSTRSTLGSFAQRLRRARVFGTPGVFQKQRSSFVMSSQDNTQSRFNAPEGEGTNGSNHGSSTRNKNGRNGKNGKTKEPHYQFNAETERENRPSKDMNDMIRAIDSVRQHMAEVDDLYEQLFQDIQGAVQNRKKVAELEKECQQKDDQIERQQDAIDSILERSGKKDEKLERKRLEIMEVEKAVEKKMADVEKLKARRELEAKQEELEMNKARKAQIEKQKAAQELELKARREKLEKEFRQRAEDEQKKVAALEAEKKRLSDQVKDLKTRNEAYVAELAAEKESFEEMAKLKGVFKEESTRSQKELQKMKDEFGLESKTLGFFRKKFGEISSQVHTISRKFSQDLNPKDWTSLHEKLRALDPHLASLPISGSEDSKLLRIAHTERIISFNLSTIVFKPFSSDNTFQPERHTAIDLLEQAALGLESSGDSKRAAAVFKSLAIRGFQSLRPLETASSVPSTRDEAFLQAVKPFLSLLVPETQYANLEDALRALVQSAISLWKSVQSDEFLDIKADLDLDPSLQTEWRSPFFDREGDANDAATVSPTSLGIFTLFPKITAKYSTDSAEPKVKVPGSFDDLKVGLQVHEICIHLGRGLSENSALVLRGEEEQHEMEEEMKDEKLRMELEATQKALADRNKMKLQRSGSASGSPPPTAE
ncbi:hypothetical protein BKA65DRAFT_295049 [Rhexocercosporidium sp. MPI-PUGE-AT-0058]|nr:hypothetical protein BKA65DRAFT_295049 [Rhexocercosporidium sp. MPI-PUGE-AT-0058]